jgi:hypothetical protein
MTIFLIVGHLRNQRFATTDPRLAKMGAQLRPKMSCQMGGPSEFRFQGADRL